MKTGVTRRKALEWATAYPVAVLVKLAARIERKKPSNATGFGLTLLRDEGPEWIAAAAAAEADRLRRDELERQERERRERERKAVDDVNAMVLAAWARMTGAQRVGLHLRAAQEAPTAALRRKLGTWTDGEPSPLALAVLQRDLSRPPGAT